MRCQAHADVDLGTNAACTTLLAIDRGGKGIVAPYFSKRFSMYFLFKLIWLFIGHS